MSKSKKITGAIFEKDRGLNQLTNWSDFMGPGDMVAGPKINGEMLSAYTFKIKIPKLGRCTD